MAWTLIRSTTTVCPQSPVHQLTYHKTLHKPAQLFKSLRISPQCLMSVFATQLRGHVPFFPRIAPPRARKVTPDPDSTRCTKP